MKHTILRDSEWGGSGGNGGSSKAQAIFENYKKRGKTQTSSNFSPACEEEQHTWIPTAKVKGVKVVANIAVLPSSKPKHYKVPYLVSGTERKA